MSIFSDKFSLLNVIDLECNLLSNFAQTQVWKIESWWATVVYNGSNTCGVFVEMIFQTWQMMFDLIFFYFFGIFKSILTLMSMFIIFVHFKVFPKPNSKYCVRLQLCFAGLSVQVRFCNIIFVEAVLCVLLFCCNFYWLFSLTVCCCV
jgi:hypothetical protein